MDQNLPPKPAGVRYAHFVGYSTTGGNQDSPHPTNLSPFHILMHPVVATLVIN